MARRLLHLASLKFSPTECGGYHINAPVFLIEAFKIIEQNITTVGLFRSPGQLKRVQLVKDSFFGDEKIPAEVSAKDVCDAVKAFFRELDEPLLTSALQDQFLRSAMALSREDIKGRSIMQLCRVLSQRHRETLAFLMWNLKRVSEFSYANRMDVSNLASIIAMSVFRSDEPLIGSCVNDAKRDSEAKASIIEILIKQADALCRLAKRSEPLPVSRNKFGLSHRSTVVRTTRTKTMVGVRDLRPPTSAEPVPPRRSSGDWSLRIPSGDETSGIKETKSIMSLKTPASSLLVGRPSVRSARRPWQRKLDISMMNSSDVTEKAETPVKITRSSSDAPERRQLDIENGQRRRSAGMPKIKRGQPNTVLTGLDRTKSKATRGQAEKVSMESYVQSLEAHLPDVIPQVQVGNARGSESLPPTASTEDIAAEEEEAKDDFVDVEFRKMELLSSKDGPPMSFNLQVHTASTPARDRASIAFIRDKNRGRVLQQTAAFENIIRQTSTATASLPRQRPVEKQMMPTFTQVASGNKRRSPTKKYQTRMATREMNHVKL